MGKDIRKLGSGNPGATNVFRTVGPLPGVMAFTLDTGKGFVASFFLPRILGGGTSLDMLGVLGGLAVVAGHMLPVFLNFKGGKGVATALGVFLGLVPFAAVSALVVWIVVISVSGYVSLASIFAAVSLPVFILALGGRGDFSAWTLGFSILVSAGVVIAHRANIKRLLSGTENRLIRRGSRRL
jgi:glycerol-3-phosphate acyltransferase PlsY